MATGDIAAEAKRAHSRVVVVFGVKAMAWTDPVPAPRKAEVKNKM